MAKAMAAAKINMAKMAANGENIEISIIIIIWRKAKIMWRLWRNGESWPKAAINIWLAAWRKNRNGVAYRMKQNEA